MGFAIIAAIDSHRGIGKENRLPWHLPSDLKHFARLTKGGTVIMGRRTWESLPTAHRPLKERKNIVITRSADYELPEGTHRAPSLDEALEKSEGEAFVIGGAQLFDEAIHHPACETLILTEIQGDYQCDTFFPEIPKNFERIEHSPMAQEGDIQFQFVEYRRRHEL